MDKESTPLKALRMLEQVCLVANVADMSGEINIIETALKDHQDLHEYIESLQDDRDYWWNIANKNEKKLKALEIIKENIGLKMNVDEDVGCLYVILGRANICIVGFVKGQDKIELLKEVLHEN